MPHSHDNNGLIIHLSTEMPFGGGERQLLYLYQGLAEKNREQRIICSAGSKLEAYCQQHYYPYLSLKRRGGFSLIYAWQLRCMLTKLLKQQPIRLIHCHDAHAHTHAVLAGLLLKMQGIVLPLIINRKVVSFPPKRFFSRLQALKYHDPAIRKILCVSKAAAVACQQWMEPHKHPEKIAILHDTVRLRDFLPPQPHSVFTIGIIGSLLPVKNHALFLRCAQQLLVHSLPMSIQFWIIGEGREREALETLVNQLDIASYVTFFGFRNDIPELLSQMDIVMVTSNNEGLCSTILQAMAAQVPVVARDVGGIPEIVQHGQTGFLGDTQDELVSHVLTLYHDKAYREQIIHNAFEHVKNYDLPIFIDKILRLYGS